MRFIGRYESKHLIGIDFDVEAGQTPAQVESLVRRIKAAQANARTCATASPSPPMPPRTAATRA